MLAELTKLLEDHNVPTNVVVEIKDLLKDGFQKEDVSKVITLIKDNEEPIRDSQALIGQIKEMGSASGALDSLKSGDFGDAINKAKGMLG